MAANRFNIHRSKLLGGCGALCIGAIAVWMYLISPQLARFDHEFSYEAILDSEDNLYDASTGAFTGDQPTRTKFTYTAEEIEADHLIIRNDFEVTTLGGQKLFTASRHYGINPITGAHTPDYGDRDRAGYLFAPRNWNSRTFTYWHVNYDTPVQMELQGEEQLYGLTVRRYEAHFRADQTAELAHLQQLPAGRGIDLDVDLQLWIEPVSGWLVKSEDHATGYFYDRESKQRLSPWNRFSNRFTDWSVREQVINADNLKHRLILIQNLIPTLLAFIALGFLGLGLFQSRLLLIAAALAAMVGGEVLLTGGNSWSMRAHGLVRPMESWTAVQLLLFGAALLCRERKQRRLFGALVGAVLALTALRLEMPYEIFPTDALVIALSALALLTNVQHADKYRWPAWILAATVAMSGLTSLAGYFGKLGSAFQWHLFTPIDYLSGVCFTSLGCALLVETFSQMDTRVRSYAIPASIFMGSLIAALFSYSLVVTQQQLITQRLIQGRSLTLSTEIQSALANRINTARRMAKRWQLARGAKYDVLIADSASYVKELSGIMAVRMVDQNFSPRWAVPEEDLLAPRLDPRANTALSASLSTAISTTSPFISKVYEIGGGQSAFTIFYPLYFDNRFDGFLELTIDSAKLLDPILENCGVEFTVDVREGKNQVRRYQSPADGFKATVKGQSVVKFAGISWDIIVRPRLHSTIGRAGYWPTIVALSCAALGLLLAVVIQLYLLARARATQFEESRNFLNSILLNLPTMVFIKEAKELRFVHLNRAGESLLGHSASELLSKNDLDLFPPEQAAFFMASDRTVLEKNKLMDIAEEPIETKSLGLRWLHTKKVPVCDSNGRPAFLLGISEDITDRKATEDALREARDRALKASLVKSEFLANMSHEIRTPMNGVIGMTNLLLDSELTVDQRDLAETVKDSAAALLAIINDILDFSKIEAGKLTLNPTPFAMDKFLHDIERLHFTRFHEKNLTFVMERGPDVPEFLVGDTHRLRQIIINLIGNALKFTAAEGAIVLHVECINSFAGNCTLRFSVIDTGVGIPQDKHAEIFEAFSQADSSTTRKYGGTGLGLTIASQLAKLMNGDIGVSSAVGRGSVFYFTAELRMSSAAELAANHSREETIPVAASSQNDGLRVLLAEDNAVNQKLVVRMLEKAGHKVVVAGNGLEALDLFGKNEFDLILMDIQMPIMGGDEATARIRATMGEKRVPIVALTAHAMSGDKEKYLAKGMDGYVSKPINAKTLLDTIREVTTSSESKG